MYDELIGELYLTASTARSKSKRELLEKAADAIEELICEVADEHNARLDSEDKLRWIPVTERLPKEGEFVLVYGDLYPNKHDGGVIAVSKRMDWNYWQGFGRERNITHWMPLPQPPKEE